MVDIRAEQQCVEAFTHHDITLPRYMESSEVQCGAFEHVIIEFRLWVLKL